MTISDDEARWRAGSWKYFGRLGTDEALVAIGRLLAERDELSTDVESLQVTIHGLENGLEQAAREMSEIKSYLRATEAKRDELQNAVGGYVIDLAAAEAELREARELLEHLVVNWNFYHMDDIEEDRVIIQRSCQWLAKQKETGGDG